MLLTMHNIMEFQDAFYCISNKGKQDNFILKYCRAEKSNPKRKRKTHIKGKSRIYEYTIVNQTGNNLHVCQNSFLSVLNIT